jgi:23S rRNA (cytidine1920-2'-O)/16S rRNA (cytidine1409-2'-O)-methyltransferase
MKRLDQFLVEVGLAPTRSKAQQMLAAGEVRVRGQVITQASHKADGLSVDDIEIQGDTLKYVSRGGLKLEAALAHLQLDVRGWRCLDVGISTGGFADCLLQHGAGEVAGFDVGHGQLAPKLNGRVCSWEGVHVKDLATHCELQEWLALGVNLIVVDVSFISLLQVIPWLPKARLLALVKPQFEVGAAQLNGRGVVKDVALFDDVRDRILRQLQNCGFTSLDYFASAVKGQDGNQEFFAYADF